MTLDDFLALFRLARLAAPPPASLRNRDAALAYRPIGAPRERYPTWIRELRGESGVYVIRDRSTAEILYVGESHTSKLYETLTRHFQTVRHEAREVPMT